MKKLGFIGMGNMAGAILSGALESKKLNPSDIMIYDINADRCAQVSADTGASVATDIENLAAECEMLLVAVKPDAVEPLIEQNRQALENKALVSVALGWPHARYRAVLPESTRVAFIMPNTPCLVREGTSILEQTHSLTQEEEEFAVGVFKSIGKVFTVKSELMNVAGSLGGCGPALIYLVIEALADGAVVHGLPRDAAYEIAANMVKGSAVMVGETKEHPARLKDNVCSPGGSTIRAVRALEDRGVRAAFIEAIDRAVNMR